jgi:two-component system, chemotaxis family, sensor kinase CheA
MDEKAEALKARFYNDASAYLAKAKTLLADLIAGRAAEDDIHELFRCIHSIKSEASYLKLEPLSEVSHALEEKLEAFRTGSVDRESLGVARNLLGQLDSAVSAAEAEEAATGRSGGPAFNPFEKRLLEEAQQRGELFYRICCDLDPETPMKKARAYLLLSNLEQISNVIRMEPSVHSQDDEAFGTISVYLTAYTDESEIYQALDIDQVVRSTVDVVDYHSLDAGFVREARISGSTADEPLTLYRLASRKLNELITYADELKITLRELDLDLSKQLDSGHSVRGRVTRMTHLAGGLFEELRQTRTAKFAEEFQRLEKMVADLATQLGKSVRIEASGGEIEVDRRNLMALSEPLGHVLRNAVDHGIEMPERRAAVGKNQTGTITITAIEEARHLSVVVSDDGGGIDEEVIRSRLEETGQDSGGELIDLISRPGFTTLESANAVSGRGVGLDLVMQRVSSIGGEIRLSSQKGRGSTFELSLPPGSAYSQLLFFRRGRQLYAVSTEMVSEVKKIAKGDLKRRASGRVFYRGLPAFAGDAEATVDGSKPYGHFAVLASSLGQSACFLAEDVLFEHDVQKSLLNQNGNERKKRLVVRFGSGKREFVYLSPSLISAANQ